jgi:hypothetical protein
MKKTDQDHDGFVQTSGWRCCKRNRGIGSPIAGGGQEATSSWECEEITYVRDGLVVPDNDSHPLGALVHEYIETIDDPRAMVR